MVLGKRLRATAIIAGLFCAGAAMCAETPQTFATPQALLRAMINEETASASRHERYKYMTTERSDRTNGHLWTERVVETSVGKVRFLLEEDGVPLSPDRVAKERARLAGILADPSTFEAQEASRMGDEAKMRQMLNNLDKGFVLDGVELINGIWHVNYKPNPSYSPSGIEERVLHGMSGWLAIDAKDLRLVHIEGKLPTDVSMGFGLVTIHSGSHFESDRELLDGHWRTTHVLTDIRGKALVFKAIAKNSDLKRSNFHYLDPNITLAQAIVLVQEP